MEWLRTGTFLPCGGAAWCVVPGPTICSSAGWCWKTCRVGCLAEGRGCRPAAEPDPDPELVEAGSGGGEVAGGGGGAGGGTPTNTCWRG